MVNTIIDNNEKNIFMHNRLKIFLRASAFVNNYFTRTLLDGCRCRMSYFDDDDGCRCRMAYVGPAMTPDDVACLLKLAMANR